MLHVLVLGLMPITRGKAGKEVVKKQQPLVSLNKHDFWEEKIIYGSQECKQMDVNIP